jgi:AcrR family transcriptional regulator
VDLEPTSPGTRRRGAELETAILDASWELLQEAGYGGFTFDAVASRAGTSRPVLYRRWPTRPELMLATIKHAGILKPVEMPDTGSVRDDALDLLRKINEARAGYSAMLSVLLGEYFRETGSNYRELRSLIKPGRNGFQMIIDRAAERDDQHWPELPSRIVDVAIDLFRLEMLMTQSRVPDENIVAMVDDVWLPLLRTYGAPV